MKTKAILIFLFFMTTQYCSSQFFDKKEKIKLQSFKLDLNQICFDPYKTRVIF